MDDHALFQQFPLAGEIETTFGREPTPYHIYDGHGLLIVGTADLSAARELTINETVHPVQTRDGEALVAVWVCEFTRASLDPHSELQFSIVVTREPVAPVGSSIGELLAMLAFNADIGMLCHGLWNNTPRVVAYNREWLHLPAQPCRSEIARADGHKRFVFRDEAGALICEGDVHEAKRTPARIGWALMRQLGARRTMQLAGQKSIASQVINPIGSLERNAAAAAHIAADSIVVQAFDPAQDTIALTLEPHSRLAFQPIFCEHFSPFRFVYLDPV